MSTPEFLEVEQPAIEQLKSLGYKYIPGVNANELRQSQNDVILTKSLESSIKKINPWINEENLYKVVRDITRIQASSLMEANQDFYEKLVKHMSYEQDLGKGRKGQTVKIIDFDNPDNNDFLVVNQLQLSEIIPDIVIFINGLPIALIECKSPYITSPMGAAISQLERYQKSNEKLFWYNQMLIATHKDKARIGTIKSSSTHFLKWEQPSQESLIGGVFPKKHLLDLMQNFIVYETTDGRTVKKLARYQQFRAVNKTIARLKSSQNRKDRGGVIWHTQGSGKSLTMVFLALKTRRDSQMRKCKLVIVTDRTQLDTQIAGTFKRCLDETVTKAKNVKHFKELLKTNRSDIITGMLQKFQERELSNFEEINNSSDIVVMVDEAHRGHYKTLGTNLNVALPNAPKIAFTGTPLIKSQKTTNEFGKYIDTYTIDQAVSDGATVQILYEGRESQTKVAGESLDALFDRYFNDKTAEEKERIKKKYSTEKAILEAPKRIEMICRDILQHYQEHIQPNGFKAMIVTVSREAAVTYKNTLDRLKAPESQVIISGSKEDRDELWFYSDKTRHKRHIADFQKKQHPLSFLIVKDMLLTGFDAPIAQVMYLDRKLMDHTLLQAIARVNRTMENKFRGYIVDYYGLSNYLKEALEIFTSEDVQGALTPLIEELPRLQRRHTRAIGHFPKEYVAKRDTEACAVLLKEEQKRRNFQADLRKFLQSMDIIMPNKAAASYIPDMEFLGRVNIRARNMFRDEQLSISGCGEKVRKLIEDYVYSTGVDPKIAPIDVLDDNFAEHIESVKSDQSRAIEIEHAIKKYITVHLDEDPVYYRKLSDRLKQILEEHHEKWKQLSQALFDFRGNIEENHKKEARELG